MYKDASVLAIVSVLGPDGLLSKVQATYEHRPEQVRMAEAVHEAIEGGGLLLVEAGTGTGKTLAYLTAVIASGARAVISTGTKNLQDQILEHDIPLLRRALGLCGGGVDVPGGNPFLKKVVSPGPPSTKTFRNFSATPQVRHFQKNHEEPFEEGVRGRSFSSEKCLPCELLRGDFSAVCLKGLGNYLCLRRLDLLARTSPLLGGDEAALLARIVRWAGETATGDRAELDDLPEDLPLWTQVCSGPDTRVGPKCPRFADCFVTRARRAAQDAQVVVVNHHLFFADLALRDEAAGILPPYDVVIFDEAHQIDAVATEFFGYRVSSRQIAHLLRDSRQAVAVLSDRPESSLERVERAIVEVEVAAMAFFSSLGEIGGSQGGRIPLRPEDTTTWSEAAVLRLDSALEGLSAFLKGLPGADEAPAACARRAETARNDLAEIVGRPRHDSVYWKEVTARTTTVGASPIDISDVMRERVFARVGTAVLTSATLTSDGDFAYVRERLGIDGDATELVLPSPFDFERQTALFIPIDAPDPRREGYLEGLARLLAATSDVVDGGTLALFTSTRDMLEVAELVRPLVMKRLRVQGERPRQSLLDELRRGPVVLLATGSFWQGVDAPGEALEAVVIARLPFASPGDPLVEARLRQLEESGRSPFKDYQVPQACLTLKQGFGRLIRQRGDRGVVAILDARVRTMGYGKVFLRSLPRCTRVETIDELREWWGRGV